MDAATVAVGRKPCPRLEWNTNPPLESPSSLRIDYTVQISKGDQIVHKSQPLSGKLFYEPVDGECWLPSGASYSWQVEARIFNENNEVVKRVNCLKPRVFSLKRRPAVKIQVNPPRDADGTSSPSGEAQNSVDIDTAIRVGNEDGKQNQPLHVSLEYGETRDIRMTVRRNGRTWTVGGRLQVVNANDYTDTGQIVIDDLTILGNHGLKLVAEKGDVTEHTYSLGGVAVVNLKLGGTVDNLTLAPHEKVVERDEGDQRALSPGEKAPGTATQPASNPSNKSAPSAIPNKTFVLIVGVNDYQDSNIPKLKYAESDAQSVYRFFATERKSPTTKDRVQILLGKDATRVKIMKAIHDHLALKATDSTDMAILYVAMHGFADARDTYLGGCDTDLTALRATTIASSDLRDAWDEIRCGHKVIVADACHSGGLEGLRGVAGVAYEKASGEPEKSRATVSFFASGANELSAEDKNMGGGVFTAALLSGLRGEADEDGDGRVTAGELSRYLVRQVPKLAAEAGGKQTPVVQGVDTGFFLTR
jgi:hypothetical protein